MLKDWMPRPAGEQNEQKARLKRSREELAALQMKLKENKLPVLVLVEGWGAAGKGSLIRSLIKELDPRFFQVVNMGRPTPEEQRYPFLKRYVQTIPEKGKIVFLDSGWMDEVVRQRQQKTIDSGEYELRLQSTEVFERQLVADGYLLVKLFLHIDRATQKKRLEALAADEDTAWRVSENDRWQQKHYGWALDCFDEYLEATDTAWAPWKILNGGDEGGTRAEAAEYLCRCIRAALAKRPGEGMMPDAHWPLLPMLPLSRIPLDVSLPEEEYRRRLKECRKKLARLHNRLYRKKVPVVILYEGWDAAGKGGNIKRLAGALDPRGYEVVPIASPTPPEKSRHYLWRFWTRLPKTGHIAIFDRSWYGRVMVERLEGFCTEADWKRAYNEINEFERELTQWGAVVVKFWVQIDKDTQLARFNDRQNTPEKQWKITDEDWRNREKWDAYEQAVDEMLQKTSTANAPWHIIESVDKRYARIKAMEIVIDAIERAL